MKVLQINAVFGYKSTGVIVRDISEELIRNHYEPRVICVDSNSNQTYVFKVKNKIENKLHAFLTRMFGLQGSWSHCSTKKIISIINVEKPDIIHLHNLHSNFIDVPQLLEYCGTSNIPVVVTLHDCWYFTGKCYHFEDIKCYRWKNGCGNCPKKMSDIPSLLMDSSHLSFIQKLKSFSAIKNLHIVGCSHWITDLARQSPIFKDASFHTISNGVDTEIFSPKALSQLDSHGFTIMVMANKWFLPENSLLRERLIVELGKDCRIVVVGCTDQQIDMYKEVASVICFGFVSDRKKLAELYQEADLFLNVTFIDTLPTVNMEAICCGTPVVSYNSGGSSELIEDGITGYVVQQNDIDSIIHYVRKIKSGAIPIEECSKIGKRDFDKNKCYEKYIKLYKEITQC